MLPLPKGGGPTYIIWSYSAWENDLLSPIYLFNRFFMSVWAHGYFFYTLGYTPILQCLFCTDFSIFAIGSFPVGSCLPLMYCAYHCGGVVFVVLCFGQIPRMR